MPITNETCWNQRVYIFAEIATFECSKDRGSGQDITRILNRALRFKPLQNINFGLALYLIFEFIIQVKTLNRVLLFVDGFEQFEDVNHVLLCILKFTVSNEISFQSIK